MDDFKTFIFSVKNRLLRRNYYAKYNELLHNQQLSHNALNELNWEKRKRIVRYAYENTVFYKKFFDSCGFHPSMLILESDWEKVPILEKSMIRDNVELLLVKNVAKKRAIQSTTGGSTGTPLKVYLDNIIPVDIITRRFLSWWGMSNADNHAIVHRKIPVSYVEKIIDFIKWYPTKRIFLNASSFNDNDIERFIEKIKKNGTKRIVGYVGAIEKIAEYILINNVYLTNIQHIWTTSAPLSNIARNKIEKAFKCKVMDQYGSCELLNIAQQCPYCDGLHINSDIVHVEFVDSLNKIINDFSIGDVVVTNLENFVFPLIRYRLGDRSNFNNLRHENCTLPFPLMSCVAGRISDMISLPSGRVISGEYLTTIFDDFVDNVLAFQIYQKKDLSIILKIVLNPKALNSDIVIDKVKNALILIVHNEIPITIECVDRIPDDRGKTRYIIKE